MDTQVERARIPSNGQPMTIEEIARQMIINNPSRGPFFVLDLNDIRRKHMRWLRNLPRVKPYYAVKCNNLPEIVNLIASLGIGFDCASRSEIDQVLACGVPASKIIYANPCKSGPFIEHARQVGADLMTFDNEFELQKLAHLHPAAKLVLRIKGDDRTSRCALNSKFGAELKSCHALLYLAKCLGLQVVGVSFHNGSGCEDANAYYKSIEASRLAFDMGQQLGHKMTLLDIGGGFPGDDGWLVRFEQLAAIVNRALDAFFPAGSGVEIIAEPGRYYVASSMVLATQVIAKRVEFFDQEKASKRVHMYYLNDGIYGALNNCFSDHYTPPVKRLLLDGHTDNSGAPDEAIDDNDDGHYDEDGGGCGGEKPNILSLTFGQQSRRDILSLRGLLAPRIQARRAAKMRPTVFWGPTCDSFDCVRKDFLFPEMQLDDWLLFENMGAYTCSTATTFNGFERAPVLVVDEELKQIDTNTRAMVPSLPSELDLISTMNITNCSDSHLKHKLEALVRG